MAPTGCLMALTEKNMPDAASVPACETMTPWTLRAGEYIDAILWQSHRQLDAAIHNAITGLYRPRLLLVAAR